VYYARSGWGRGLSVKLMSYPVGGPANSVLAFPRGVDLYTTYALDRADGTTSVFYDADGCGGDPDIYEVNLP